MASCTFDFVAVPETDNDRHTNAGKWRMPCQMELLHKWLRSPSLGVAAIAGEAACFLDLRVALRVQKNDMREHGSMWVLWHR